MPKTHYTNFCKEKQTQIPEIKYLQNSLLHLQTQIWHYIDISKEIINIKTLEEKQKQT